MEKIVYDFYKNYYDRLFCYGGFSAFSYRLTHKLVENNFCRSDSNSMHGQSNSLELEDEKFLILEVGAGKGEHIEYVKSNFSEYVCLDLFEEPNGWENREDKRLEWITGDISSINFAQKKFDRVIMMCVLHHLSDPLQALRNILHLLKDEGSLTLFLPSDPGILNRLNRAMFVNSKARRIGFQEYDLVNAIEHRNHYWGLKTLITNVFAECSIQKRYYPLNIPVANLTLFSVWNIRKEVKR